MYICTLSATALTLCSNNYSSKMQHACKVRKQNFHAYLNPSTLIDFEIPEEYYNTLTAWQTILISLTRLYS